MFLFWNSENILYNLSIKFPEIEIPNMIQRKEDTLERWEEFSSHEQTTTVLSMVIHKALVQYHYETPLMPHNFEKKQNTYKYETL